MARNNYINVLIISWTWIIGWLINYMYHPIMLRYLTIEEFWTFGSLVWMFNILGVLTMWFILFLNREVSKNINNKWKIKSIFYDSAKFFLVLGVIFYFVYLLFSWILSDFLKINDPRLIYIVGLSIILWFLWISESAILRWLKKFEFLGIISILWPLFKLWLWFLLVFLWYKIYWAVIWFILWWLFSLVVSFFFLFNYFKKVKKIWDAKELFTDFKKNKKDIINFFFVSAFFTIFMNIDVILAKNIFNETNAWIYAWISILWKFLIFLLLSVETVYYSQIMEFSKNKLPKYLIKNPLIILVVISVSAIIFNIFFGSFILWLLKPELAAYNKIYILCLVYYSLLAIISFFSKILVWWKNKLINYVMWFLLVFLLFIVYIFWNNLLNFIYSFIVFWFISTIIISFIFYIELKK